MESTILEDWKNAANQDTPVRAIAQGLSRATGGGFGSAKQADVPAADQAAYASGAVKPPRPVAQNRQPPAAAAGLGLPSYGNEGRVTRSAIDGSTPTGMQQWNPVGQKPYNVEQTSEPGISKITGNGLSSPLYTNLNNVNQAIDGLKKPMIASGLPGYGAQAAAQGITSTPFSAVNAGGGAVPGIAAGMPEGLARQAMANAIRQQQIDAQPRGGIAIMADTAERSNATLARMERNQQIADMAEAIRRGYPAAGAAAAGIGAFTNAEAQRSVEGMRQKGIAAGLDLQRRGQDIGQAAEAAKLGLTLRGQDMESQRNDARLGLDIGRLGIENQRFGLEKSAMQRRQSAQDNLAKAIDSGDQNAIARARTMAAAAGVRLEQAPGVRDRFLTLTEQDANGNKVEVAVDPLTGKTIRPQGVAPDRPVGTVSKVGDRVAVWDGSKWVEKS